MTTLYRADFTSIFENICSIADNVIFPYFGQNIEIESKSDLSPVTIADKNTEEKIREFLSKEFPQHSIVGEEFGESGPTDADYQWVLDPIDGTKSFIAGLPIFGTLVALLFKEKPVVGCIHFPMLKQTLLGFNQEGTFLNGSQIFHTRNNELSDSILLTTCIKDSNHILGQNFTNLANQVRYARTWGDCYGHFLVATGKADIMVDPILSKWDIAALKPCVNGVGCAFFDLSGDSDGLGSQAISSSPKLKSKILDILNG